MAQYVFGTGKLYGTTVGGGSPIQFGAIQGVSVDITADVKELYGQYQFALAVARGKVKVEGKANFANIDLGAYNSLFFSGSSVTGTKTPIFAEAATIPSTPFQVTVANGATMAIDLGVVDASTGLPYTQVASGPTTGQYSVNSVTGVYTFASADATKQVLIDYIYTAASTGKTLTITNNLMAVAPTFQMVCSETFNGKTFVLVLFSCVSSKLNLPFKQDDFMVPELDFKAQANGANQIGYISATNT